MPETYTVLDVTQATVSNTDCWVVRQRRPDGLDHLHIMPVGILAMRGAELGIDDPEALLDIVLHEPHIPAADHPEKAEPRPALRGRPEESPAELHLGRVAAAKQRVQVVRPKTGPGVADPLDVILRHARAARPARGEAA
ncbi:hypothetical protein ACWGB8_02045 [Kitasatospora sp. NPDC054939]